MKVSFRRLVKQVVEILLLVLAGCSGGVGLPVAGSPTGTPSTVISPTSSVQPAPTVPSASATVAATARPTRPPSGWTMYTNPDFVSQLVVQDRTLWGATMGGVIAWDLDQQIPTLYTTRDGLAEIQANDIVACSMPTKRIIVAHPSGVLSIYDLDLHKWSQMPITFSDGSTLHRAQALFCDESGKRLLVGSAEGLGVQDMTTGQWKRIGPKEGLSVDKIYAIDVAGQAIWLAAGDQGAFLVSGDNIFPFDGSSGFPSGKMNDLAVAPDMTVWFGYSTGLVHYKDKKWYPFGAQSPEGMPFTSIDHVAVGADQRIWIANAQEGACPFDPVTLFCSTIYPGIRGVPITDLVIGPDGTAYAATGGSGILILTADHVLHLEYKNQQLVSNNVLDITSGPEGKLWVATDHGVNVIDPAVVSDPWRLISTSPNQLLYSNVNALLSTATGMWLFYEHEAQASFLNGESWQQVRDLVDNSGSIRAAAIDQRGYLWLATDQGIRVWDGSVSRIYEPPKDMSTSLPRTFLPDGERMWVGTDQGLFCYERYQWQVILPGMVINTIQSGPDGTLYIGTNRGLVRYQNGQSFLWMINLGNQMVVDSDVTSIAWDGSGHLWLGTANQGLFQYDGKKWNQYNTFSGLPANRIRKIITDRLGAIWVVTSTGEGGGALVRFVP